MDSIKKLPLIGVRIENSENYMSSYKKLGDLIYYEGPIESMFIKDGEYYIFLWRGEDNSCHRWLMFHTEKNNLVNFFVKKISLLNLIQKSDDIHLVDIRGIKNSKIIVKNVFKVSFNELIDDYLPAEEAMFEEDFYEDYAIQLKQELLELEKE